MCRCPPRATPSVTGTRRCPARGGGVAGAHEYRRRQGHLQGAGANSGVRQRPGPQSRTEAVPRARPGGRHGDHLVVRPGSQYGVHLAPGMGLKRCQPWSCSRAQNPGRDRRNRGPSPLDPYPRCRSDTARAVEQSDLRVIASRKSLPRRRSIHFQALRAPNTPMLVACWLAVVKAGGIAVPTMPLLRARELAQICSRLEVALALCDDRFVDELDAACAGEGDACRILTFSDLAGRMRQKPADFPPAPTDADDICLIAFTSGTTGIPKAVAHFHRDLLAVTEGLPRSVLGVQTGDVFCAGSSLAFTYGLGGAVLFPLRAGATSVLVEVPTPEGLLDAVSDHGVTICLSIPHTVPWPDWPRAGKCRSCGPASPPLKRCL